jgi:7-keto-8-aminopelargonate synthetase-like enzyme
MSVHPGLQARVEEFLEALRDHPAPGQYYPVLSSPSVAHVRMQNRQMSEPREFLNFATSNYLGLWHRPEVRVALLEAYDRYGSGANGSPVLSGYYEVHRDLEKELAEFHGAGDAVLFCSGIGANIGAVSALMGPKDAVVLDQSAHGSIFEGARLSGARLRVYGHQDYDELDWLLQRLQGQAKTVLVATCGIFSMTGEIDDLPRVIETSRRHGAAVLVDDAHGLGVLGKTGRGTLEHFGLPEDAVDIHMGTMSKSLSASGGYIVANGSIVEFLRYSAKFHLLTASLPPCVAGASLAALRILRREGAELSAGVRHKANLFRSLLTDRGVDAGGRDSGIIPVRLNSEDKIWPVNERLLERGIFLNPVIYPGVPKGKGRLRFAVTLTHPDEEIARAAAAVAECIAECGAGCGRRAA